ncbi:MAG: matrixin family metalloprotease, partial [Arenicellales bacterium]
MPGRFNGDVWFNDQQSWGLTEPGNYYHQTVLHEIGHALGLKHPHEDAYVMSDLSDSLAFT